MFCHFSALIFNYYYNYSIEVIHNHNISFSMNSDLYILALIK